MSGLTAASVARAIRNGERSPVSTVEPCPGRVADADCDAFATGVPAAATLRAEHTRIHSYRL